jgi:Holliday junction resolvase RusA-like endonuclease
LIWVQGLPIAQGSKNAFRRGNRIVLVESAKGLKSWRETIAHVAKQTHKVPTTDAVTISLLFLMPAPKKMVRRYPTTKPDLDKLTRAVLDALTGVIYADDSQVVQIEAQKGYTYGKPGVYIAHKTLDNGLVTHEKKAKLAP